MIPPIRRRRASGDADGKAGVKGSREHDSTDDSLRNSTMVASGIAVSRITGLARERALGHFLGTGFAADAFTAAFRIPNLLQHLLGEGVLSASFIPVYSRLLSQGREREAGRVAGAVAGLLSVAAGVVALVGILLARPLTAVIAPGLEGRTLELTISLVRILFPGVGFLVLSAWCLGVLNSHRRFLLPYLAPALLNLTQIGVLIWAGLRSFSSDSAAADLAAAQVSIATWLALGTVLGGALQFVVQLPSVRRVEKTLRPSLRTDLPGVRKTLRAFGPVVTARGVVQLSSYVQVFLASFLAVGALASLRFAQILYMLPISLFGMAVAAAELPDLSRADLGQGQVAVARLQRGLERIAVLVVPTTLGYLVIGDLIVGALFQSGEFLRLDSVAVWIVLGGYSLGLLATTSSRLLQSALYGRGDARTPARVAVLRVLTSAALGVVLMTQLDRLAVTETGVHLLGELPAFAPLSETERGATSGGDLVRLGAAGLSLASGLAAWLEYALLRRAVGRVVGPTSLAGGRLRPVIIAATIAAVAAGLVRPLLTDLHPIAGGSIVVVVMAAAYLSTASAMGVSEIRNLLAGVRRRLTRS
jgi:putative peptidoglycan lipid II flippase